MSNLYLENDENTIQQFIRDFNELYDDVQLSYIEQIIPNRKTGYNTYNLECKIEDNLFNVQLKWNCKLLSYIFLIAKFHSRKTFIFNEDIRLDDYDFIYKWLHFINEIQTNEKHYITRFIKGSEELYNVSINVTSYLDGYSVIFYNQVFKNVFKSIQEGKDNLIEILYIDSLNGENEYLLNLVVDKDNKAYFNILDTNDVPICDLFPIEEFGYSRVASLFKLHLDKT